MIKNIKWLVLVSLTVVACTNNNDEVITEAPLTAGTADFSKYVGLGDSMCAGYSDGALFKAGQSNSYANILSQQFALVGGGAFTNPFMNDNIGGYTIGGTLYGAPRLAILGTNPDGSPKIGSLPTTPTTEIANHLSGYYNNMGIPGAKSTHLLAPGYGSLAGLANGTANPYFVRFSSSSTASILSDAIAQNPTFFTLWIGGNDVLGYATTGGDGTDPITPPSGAPGVGFDGTYNAIVNTLTSQGAKGAVANIPYVNTIPYFTTVPYNPIPLDAPTISLLMNTTNGYGKYNNGIQQVLNLGLISAAEAAKRTIAFHVGKDNSVVIEDSYLTSLTAYGIPSIRQATLEDLVVLPAKNFIGTTIGGNPLYVNGVSVPLADKWVLSKDEVSELTVATDAYNVTIKSIASAKGLAFVDANGIISKMNSGGIVANGFTMTSSYVTGNTFSLDGVHPSPRGYALIANKFVEAINATYGSNLKGVSLGNYQILYSAALQ